MKGGFEATLVSTLGPRLHEKAHTKKVSGGEETLGIGPTVRKQLRLSLGVSKEARHSGT